MDTWCGTALCLRLSPPLPNDAQKHGRASSLRRERASIRDQSRVRNKLQLVSQIVQFYILPSVPNRMDLQRFFIFLATAILTNVQESANTAG